MAALFRARPVPSAAGLAAAASLLLSFSGRVKGVPAWMPPVLFWLALVLALCAAVAWVRDAVVRAELRRLLTEAINHADFMPSDEPPKTVYGWEHAVQEWVTVGFGAHEAQRLTDYSGLTFAPASGGQIETELARFRFRLRELSDRMASLPVNLRFPIRKYKGRSV